MQTGVDCISQPLFCGLPTLNSGRFSCLGFDGKGGLVILAARLLGGPSSSTTCRFPEWVVVEVVVDSTCTNTYVLAILVAHWE